MRNTAFKIIIPLVLSLLLIGAGIFVVELRNTSADDPLVDLSQVISVGGSFMPSDNTSVTDTEASDDPVGEHDPTPAATVSPTDHPDTAEMVIYGTTITWNGYEKTIGSAKTYLQTYYGRGTHIVIKNRYADYRTFREIKEFIDENGIDAEIRDE